MSNTPILITGASGRLGQIVVQTLTQQGIHKQRQLILATRFPEKIINYKEPGVEIRHADFDALHTLSNAFLGAKRMLLISTNMLDGTGKRVQQHHNAIEAAKHAGIEHVVYTSFIQPLHGLRMPPAADHLATEEVIKQSKLSYTFLRNAFYYDMLIPMLKQALTQRYITSATGKATIAYIDRQDCAKAAAKALISDDLKNETLTLTGETLNMQTLVDKLIPLIKKPISCQTISLEQKQQALIDAGFPSAVAQLLVEIDKSLSQGALGIQTTDFKQLTGTHPVQLTDFISKQL